MIFFVEISSLKLDYVFMVNWMNKLFIRSWRFHKLFILASCFSSQLGSLSFCHILRKANHMVDNFAKHGVRRNAKFYYMELPADVWIEVLETPSVSEDERVAILINIADDWRILIRNYLQIEELLNINEVVRMIERTSGYYMIDDIFYKRSTSAPLLKCLSPQKSSYVLQEIYEGVCGLHTSSSSSGDISRILLANHTLGCHGPSE